MRRVYKYGTGQPVPEDAKYLSTQVQTRLWEDGKTITDVGGPTAGQTYTYPGQWIECWLVWHYYEVDA